MKKGYKRLLIFEILIIVILLLNNFVLSVLGGYFKVLFLALLLILFYFIFGFEKDRNRYWKTICLEVCIFLLIYFLIYYISGFIFTFYQPINYYTFSSIINIIIPLILSIILKEFLRYQMIKKSEGSDVLIIITYILFIFVDLANLYNIMVFNSAYDTFMFLALYLLPCTSKNILCTYISSKAGYKPCLLYSLVMELYVYLLPLLPNPNQYMYSIFQLISPLILTYRIHLFYKADRDEYIEAKRYQKKFYSLIPCTIIILILVYLTSGYFNYHALVIGSGSMVPKILKGDVVIVDKNKNKKENLEIGQIIAVQYQETIIIHRLVKKVKVDDQYFYYTKGDANENVDSYKISMDMIYGVVEFKIPYIGYPTIWLKNI